MASEHEKYLCDHIFHKPVIVYNYPSKIKAFYMRENEDQKTVAAFDILAPEVGEIVGGSQREERLEVLEAKLDKLGLPKEDYWWYLELRKFGTVPHSGFGLGFERLVMMATGIENIRDVACFPRTPGNAEFWSYTCSIQLLLILRNEIKLVYDWFELNNYFIYHLLYLY